MVERRDVGRIKKDMIVQGAREEERGRERTGEEESRSQTNNITLMTRMWFLLIHFCFQEY